MNFAKKNDYKKNKEFAEALVYFLEIAVDFHIFYLAIQKLTSVQVEMAVNTWQIIQVDYHCRKNEHLRKANAEMSALKVRTAFCGNDFRMPEAPVNMVKSPICPHHT